MRTQILVTIGHPAHVRPEDIRANLDEHMSDEISDGVWGNSAEIAHVVQVVTPKMVAEVVRAVLR